MKNKSIVAILMVIVLAFSVIALVIPESEYNVSEGGFGISASYNLDAYFWGVTTHSGVNAHSIYSGSSSNTTYWWSQSSSNMVDYYLISLAGIALAIAGSIGTIVATSGKKKGKAIRVLSVLAGVGSLIAVIFFVLGNSDMENNLGITTSLYFGFYLTVINIVLSFIGTAIG